MLSRSFASVVAFTPELIHTRILSNYSLSSFSLTKCLAAERALRLISDISAYYCPKYRMSFLIRILSLNCSSSSCTIDVFIRHAVLLSYFFNLHVSFAYEKTEKISSRNESCECFPSLSRDPSVACVIT